MTAFESRFEPSTCALVVVDVQNDFCDPAGALAVAGLDTSSAVAMVPALDRFVTAARSVGVTVVFVQTTHDDSTDTATWLRRTGDRPAAAPVQSCRPGTWGAEFYGVTPRPGDEIVGKHRFSAFAGTVLNDVLARKAVRSLLFTGVATEVCVESSLREAVSLDYQVTLVSDCCASYQAAGHLGAIANVRRHFGVVADSDQITAQWDASAPSMSARAVGR